MSSFLNDFEKLHPAAPAPETPAPASSVNMDDVKLYMDSIKESILTQVGDMLKNSVTTPAPAGDDIGNNNSNDEGGNENVSNSDL